MSSANLATTGGRNLMGIIIAHEVAHFLGLNHNGTGANFMAASTSGSNTDITHQQYIDMTDHGFVSKFVI
jgi:predicted Zn-dependent protease